MMFNGEALGTIPIKIGKLTRIPVPAISISHGYEHNVQHNVVASGKKVHEYSMTEQNYHYLQMI